MNEAAIEESCKSIRGFAREIMKKMQSGEIKPGLKAEDADKAFLIIVNALTEEGVDDINTFVKSSKAGKVGYLIENMEKLLRGVAFICVSVAIEDYLDKEKGRALTQSAHSMFMHLRDSLTEDSVMSLLSKVFAPKGS